MPMPWVLARLEVEVAEAVAEVLSSPPAHDQAQSEHHQFLQFVTFLELLVGDLVDHPSK